MHRGELHGHQVAVKIAHPGSADGRADLLREVSLLRAADHANIVRIYDAFERPFGAQASPALWVVMELCTGGSAEDLTLRLGRPLDEACIGYICRGALNGLVYLHSRGVINRDIKAANILLAADATVKLADLGVATQLQHTLSSRNSVVGTPTHMAPEAMTPRFGGRPGYDNRVDVWSLGITAIYLAEGDVPAYGTDDPEELAAWLIREPPPALRWTTPASPLFRQFVATVLVKEAWVRPSAAALATHVFIVSATSESLVRCLTGAQNQSGASPRTTPAGRSLKQTVPSRRPTHFHHMSSEVSRSFAWRPASEQMMIRNEGMCIALWLISMLLASVLPLDMPDTKMRPR